VATGTEGSISDPCGGRRELGEMSLEDQTEKKRRSADASLQQRRKGPFVLAERPKKEEKQNGATGERESTPSEGGRKRIRTPRYDFKIKGNPEPRGAGRKPGPRPQQKK